MIEVKNIYHSYKKNDEYAVNDVSFTIEKGEIFGFLGPSGAGKTTTQGVLVGLLDLQQGDLEMVGLGEEAKKKAGDYSKGMMQRLGFARSMINKPDIWFLDEPTMGMDPIAANSIKNIIRKKQAEGPPFLLQRLVR